MMREGGETEKKGKKTISATAMSELSAFQIPCPQTRKCGRDDRSFVANPFPNRSSHVALKIDVYFATFFPCFFYVVSTL